ncbi:hypothetical protein JXA56_05010 [Candidatus Micrarchaeota archaeon]|nr:hypothetical protein [Candidatus Micrarchaeota archaeon]
MRILKRGEEGRNSVKISSDFSLDELKLAYHLAENAFKQGKNIAKKMKLEFLLWLCGTRDIKNALKKSKGDHLLILDGPEIIENEPGFRENADPERLEKISLSRI